MVLAYLWYLCFDNQLLIANIFKIAMKMPNVSERWSYLMQLWPKMPLKRSAVIQESKEDYLTLNVNVLIQKGKERYLFLSTIVQLRIIEPNTFFSTWHYFFICHKFSREEIVKDMRKAIRVECLSEDIFEDLRRVNAMIITVDILRIDSFEIISLWIELYSSYKLSKPKLSCFVKVNTNVVHIYKQSNNLIVLLDICCEIGQLYHWLERSKFAVLLYLELRQRPKTWKITVKYKLVGVRVFFIIEAYWYLVVWVQSFVGKQG